MMFKWLLRVMTVMAMCTVVPGTWNPVAGASIIWNEMVTDGGWMLFVCVVYGSILWMFTEWGLGE